MASSRPAGTAHNEDEDEELWRQLLKDKEDALVHGLRLYKSTVVTKCKERQILGDKEILEMKNLNPEQKVRKIIYFVSQGNRSTYERFRNILKGCQLTALYELLEVKKAKPVEQVACQGGYADLVNEVRRGNAKMDDVLTEMIQMRKTQKEEIEFLQSLLKQREESCKIHLQKIEDLEAELKQNKGSRHEVESLENELNEKQKTYQALKIERDKLRERLQEIEQNMGSDINNTRR